MNKINTIVLYSESDKAFQEEFQDSVVMISRSIADISYLKIEDITQDNIDSLLSSDIKLVIFLYSSKLNAKLDKIANIMPDLYAQQEAKAKRFVVVRLVLCDNSGYFIDKLSAIPNIPNGEKCIGYPDNNPMWYEVAKRLRVTMNNMLGIA